MIDAETITRYAGYATTGLIATALGLQQVMKRWKSTEAETSILSLLHTELERMAIQNTTLSTYVNKLQLEATKINLELGKLQLENQRLHSEIVTLTKEVIKLRGMLPNKGTD